MGDGWVVLADELWALLLDPWVLFEFLTIAMVFAWIAGRLLGASKRSWRAGIGLMQEPITAREDSE